MTDFTQSKAVWDNYVFPSFKKTMTRTAATVTNDNVSGSESIAYAAADDTYTGIFYHRDEKWSQENPGLLQDADAILLIQTSQTLNKDDKITYNSKNYRVDTVISRRLGTTEFYKVARLFLI